MLIYLSTDAHSDTMGTYRKHWAGPLRQQVRLMAYETLGLRRRLPRAAYIFSDLERLNTRQLALAERLWQTLRQQGLGPHLYNNPTHVLGREALLRALHASGQNPHAVRRIDENLDGLHYPVFVRQANNHEGVAGGLLADRAALNRAIAALAGDPTAAGNALIIEFCDTADPDGIYTKYSAFCMGGQIVPRHVLFSRKWMLKFSDIITPATVALEARYLRENPHEAALQRIFAVARIDYGRIDYSILHDRIQGDRLVTWEINTNPNPCLPPQYVAPERLGLTKVFFDSYNCRLAEMANVPAGAPIVWKIPRDQRAALAARPRDCLHALARQAVRIAGKSGPRLVRGWNKLKRLALSRHASMPPMKAHHA